MPAPSREGASRRATDLDVVVVGAGPAGLTAARELTGRDVPVTVYEATDVVGGISQTVERDGWRFDIGGHRFFTKVPRVEAFWHDVLGPEDFLLRPRMSRILYDGKFFDYPLKPLAALRALGVRQALLCTLSFLWVRLRKPRQDSLEGWVASRFGWRLYRIFFKTYTEKVWGIPASQMPADWGAQRIKDLSLLNAVTTALLPRRGGRQITSLIERFQYPKYGPGMMWQHAAAQVRDRGGEVVLSAPVLAMHRDGSGAVRAVTVEVDGERQRRECTDVISSMPLSALVRAMDPPAPAEVRAAADDLRYRDFLTVALVVPEAAGFPDNWIYIHTPGVRVGRIQNFGSWSPYLVKDGRTCLGLEYFVNEGDEMWASRDEDLVTLATRELRELGLLTGPDPEAGYVVRMPKAYPVYDDRYAANVDTIRAWLESAVGNVWPAGRNGMHRYNNQDHSMLTAMLAAENVLGAKHDLWSVNVEADYHEQDTSREAGTGRGAPVIARPSETTAA